VQALRFRVRSALLQANLEGRLLQALDVIRRRRDGVDEQSRTPTENDEVYRLRTQARDVLIRASETRMQTEIRRTSLPCRSRGAVDFEIPSSKRQKCVGSQAARDPAARAAWKNMLDSELRQAGGKLPWKRVRVALASRYREIVGYDGDEAFLGLCALANIPAAYLSKTDHFVRLPKKCWNA